MAAPCPLCAHTGGTPIWQNAHMRVVRVDDAFAADYPAFTRVVWQAHVREMTDLSATERAALMAVVWMVEQAQRDYLQPDKVNLASFGNMVPHVHWHIIPRYVGDAHWPNPPWDKRTQTEKTQPTHDHKKSTQAIRRGASVEQLASYWDNLAANLASNFGSKLS